MAIATVICVNPKCVESVYSTHPVVHQNHYIRIDGIIGSSIPNGFAKCSSCNDYGLVVIALSFHYTGTVVDDGADKMSPYHSPHLNNSCLPPPIPFPFAPGTIPVFKSAFSDEDVDIDFNFHSDGSSRPPQTRWIPPTPPKSHKAPLSPRALVPNVDAYIAPVPDYLSEESLRRTQILRDKIAATRAQNDYAKASALQRILDSMLDQEKERLARLKKLT